MSSSTTRSSLPTKQYKYWIDGQDLQHLLSFVLTQIQNFKIDEKVLLKSEVTAQNGGTGKQPKDSNLLKMPSSSKHHSSRYVCEKICDGDAESMSLIHQIETESKLKIEDILQTNQGLKKVYFVENSKFITSVYSKRMQEELLQKLREMTDLFSVYQSKFQSKKLRLCFSTQGELFSIFFKIFGQQIFASPVARKVLHELWVSIQLFRSATNLQPLSQMSFQLYFSLILFCKGRELFHSSRQDYPLHRAVFENNLPMINRLIKCTHDGVFYVNKNELDCCGNSPLTLAVKLGSMDAIKVLSDLFTCPKLKAIPSQPCAIDIASSMKNKDILRVLLETNQKIKQHYLDLHQEAIFKALEDIPDFKIDIKFHCKSKFIPFVKNITPSDTYKIYKQGSQIRLDMTLLGFRKLKCVRGNLSVLFKGRGQENAGEMFIVDHDMKSVQSIFTDIAQAKIDKDIEDIMNEQQYQKLFKAEKFKIFPDQDKRGEPIEKQIEGYNCEKFQVKTTFQMTKYKMNLFEMQSLQKFEHFEDYLKYQAVDLFSQNELTDLGKERDLNLSNINRMDSGSNLNEIGVNLGSGAWNLFTQTNEGKQDPSGGLLPKNSQAKEAMNNSNINNTIIGYNNQKITKKTLSANIWICKNHPLSLDSFFPLLHVLSFSSKQIAKFKDYLDKYNLPKGYFPLKAKLPLFFSMKAAFSLQNLSFDISDFSPNLFTVDEEYNKLKGANMNALLQYSVRGGSLIEIISPNRTSHTLDEIYKLCKTDEDYQDDDDDSESLERANELFNSMMKKGVNQSEELLLDLSSFHSEYDSLDLSEKHLKDESFKIGSHAFNQVQTMNQINVRHDEDEVQYRHKQKRINEMRKRHQKARPVSKNQNKASFTNQTSDGENLFDSKILEERKTSLNKAKVSLTKNQMVPSSTIHQYNLNKDQNPFSSYDKSQTTGMTNARLEQMNKQGDKNSDTVQTLKRNFQPRNMKNYKNLMKFESQQNQLMEGVEMQGQTEQNFQTPYVSTADTSVLTNKISSFFAQQNNQIRQHPNNVWGKLLTNKQQQQQQQYRGVGAQYLHTIDSEEVAGTEGPENFSQIGNQTIGQNNSAVVTNSNFDDAFSRKSFVQSFSQLNHHKQGSRESSLKSFHSDGAHHPPLMRHTQGSVKTPGILQEESLTQARASVFSGSGSKAQNINKEEKKALVNHNSLITSIHNFVNQQQLQFTQAITPQKQKATPQQTNTFNPTFQFTPQQAQNVLQTKQGSSAQTDKTLEEVLQSSSKTSTQLKLNAPNTSSHTNINSKALLPPKSQHRKQSSYGGSGSSVIVGVNATTAGMMTQKSDSQKDQDSGSKTEGQNLFTKIFGNSFSRANAHALNTHQPKSNDADINIARQNMDKMANSTFSGNIFQKCTQQKQGAVSNFFKDRGPTASPFQTYDSSKNRPISNTQYIQSPSLFSMAKDVDPFAPLKPTTIGMVSVEARPTSNKKKTNDVDIFLPYQF